MNVLFKLLTRYYQNMYLLQVLTDYPTTNDYKRLLMSTHIIKDKLVFNTISLNYLHKSILRDFY
jgi:hypothetical protein